MLFFGVVFRDLWRTRKSAAAQNERGVVLVVVTLMLTVIMGCAGMSVDLGNWYLTTNRLQQAADAAAMAGAPFLPTDIDGARKAATESLKANGISTNHISYTNKIGTLNGDDRFEHHVYMAPDPTDKKVMQVEVGKKVQNYFIAMIGLSENQFVRTGSSVYQAPIPMGSPAPVLGAEPAGDAQGNLASTSDLSMNGKYWLNISGPLGNKSNGDQFATNNCDAGKSGCLNGKNTDFAYDSSTRSHRYLVHVPRNSGKVTVQMFDGAYVDVGDTCSQYKANLAAAATVTGDTKTFAPDASAYCTGDYNQGNNGTANPAITANTYYSAALNSLGGQINSVQFPAARTASEVTSMMKGGASGNANKPSLSDSLRKWAPIATFPASSKDADYVIEVKTPANSAGANRFALRAGVLNSRNVFDTSKGKGVTVASQGHLTVYTNATAADTSFYFAKLTSNAAGRTIEVNLFDIGDTGPNDTVDLQLVAPSGAAGLTNGFDGKCEQVGPEVGLVNVKSGVCGITGASTTRYNGQSVVLKVQVPETYRCTDNGGSECWMSLRFLVKSPQAITSTTPSRDTTTWSVQACGRPLALVANDPSQRKDCAAS